MNSYSNSVGSVKYWIGRTVLAMFGWKVLGEIPARGKFVLIGAPHTSNWDFPLAIAASYVYRIKLHWLGKDRLFRWPVGWFMRQLGGIPVDRSQTHGVVEQISRQFEGCNNLILAIAPKGTRKKARYWKSGFYWIAHCAQVPILCCYMDYRNKRVCAGLILVPTGNVQQDMRLIREFFNQIHGKHPQLEDSIRLKEEDM